MTETKKQRSALSFHLTECSRFEGFYFTDGEDHGIKNIFNTNSFKSAYQQMVTSELINSCAFVTVSKDGSWEATRKPHKMGRPLIEALVYRPTIERPFGRSRITRDVMEIIDNATRESVRTEIQSRHGLRTLPPLRWFRKAMQ